MGTLATVLRRTGLVLAALLSVGGVVFALAYAFEDLETAQALLLTAAVAVPLAALTLLAVLKPHVTPSVLTIGVALYAAYAVLGLFIDVMEAPDVPVIALVLGLPVAVMGQRHGVWAGLLLLALAAFPLLQVLSRTVTEAEVDRPGLGGLLGGSTGVVVVPLAVLGVLFLVAGALGREAPAPRPDDVQPPTREAQLH